jgi:hypothetical protein
MHAWLHGVASVVQLVAGSRSDPAQADHNNLTRMLGQNGMIWKADFILE